MSSFIVSKKTIDEIIFYLDYADKDALGNELWDMNVKAYKSRYGGEVSNEKYHYTEPEDKSLLQAHKSITCLLYQCNEGYISKTQKYKMLENIRGALANTIVMELEGYDEKNWGD